MIVSDAWSRRSLATVASLTAWLSSSPSLAQEEKVPSESAQPTPPAPPAAPAAKPDAPPAHEPVFPDAVFAAPHGQQVVLTMRTGSTVAVLVLASSGDSVTCAMIPSGQLVSVAKREIFDARVILAATYPPRAEPRVAAPPPPPAPLPPSTRYFGMHLSMAPSLMLDVDYRYLLAFVNVSILMPFLTGTTAESGTPFGGFATSHLWAFAFGAGATFRFAPTTRWKFDLFAIGAGSNWNPNGPFDAPYAALGLGLGFHVTLDQGFTFGLKGPIVGGATGTPGGSTNSLGTFYAASAVGLPLVSFGYRF